MGLQSAMTTALTGLQAAETTIDVVGNNIANSNTVGFKSSEVVFATQFLQTQSIGSAPTNSSGGTNPRQIGLGAKVAAITPNFSQGTIEISSNGLDVAIQGDGFLAVQGSQGERLYTRNGQLSLNSLNEVVTSTGNRVLGYVAEDFVLDTSQLRPLTIPLGGERVAQSTSTANFSGVLNPTIEVGAAPAIVSSETLGDGSIAFPADTDLTALERDAPGIGTGTINTTTAGGLDTGDYRYRLAWRDPSGVAGANTTSPSVEWTVTGVSAGQSIDLSALPTAGSPYDEWVLYRTEHNGTDFYELGSFATGTALPITDTTSDADLVTNAGGTIYDGSALENGTYSYYVTYYNSSTQAESRPSVRLGPIALDNDSSSVRLDLSNLDPPPTGTGSDFNQIRIYRNQPGNTNTYFQVAELTAPTFTGELQSYIDTTPSASLTGANELDFDGPKAGGATSLVNLTTRDGDTFTNVFDLGTATSGELFFAGEKGGATLEEKSLTIDSSTTVDDLLVFMQQTLGLDQTSNVVGFDLPPDPSIPPAEVTIVDGAIRITSNLGEENSVDIPLTAFRLQPEGSAISNSVSVSFSETQAADGPGTTTEFIVYDSLGSPLTIRMTTVLESTTSDSTVYRWYATSADSNRTPPDQSTLIGNGIMQFDSRGNLQSSPSDRISIFRNLTASESPLEIDLDFSSVTALAETDASGNPTSSFNMTSQDGFPPGVLTDFLITESGLIQGQFSNGTQRTLGQMILGRFANPQGLQQVGDSLFAANVNSGEVVLSEPGADGLGSITAGAVELSNTDVGQDLIEMILAQTQYQAGSRVISAAQELLDELLALQR